MEQVEAIKRQIERLRSIRDDLAIRMTLKPQNDYELYDEYVLVKRHLRVAEEALVAAQDRETAQQ